MQQETGYFKIYITKDELFFIIRSKIRNKNQ